MENNIQESELITNPDGSIYHLHLLPEQLATSVILVGDQNRVSLISKHFSSIEHKVASREFVTHTGVYKGKRISVVSTGIGPDNIDIVLNELDALVNIDLKTKTIKPQHSSLRLVRIGTSGALQAEIEVDSFVISEYAVGLDNLIYYYKDYKQVIDADAMSDFNRNAQCKIPNVLPYLVKGDDVLVQLLQNGAHKGITATAPGFYGPQGRHLRKAPFSLTFNETLSAYSYKNTKLTNFEMETSALYALSKLLGHQAATLCVIVANRVSKTFSKNYHIPMDELIQKVLNDLTK